jgi:hypothetical protein
MARRGHFEKFTFAGFVRFGAVYLDNARLLVKYRGIPPFLELQVQVVGTATTPTKFTRHWMHQKHFLPLLWSAG